MARSWSAGGSVGETSRTGSMSAHLTRRRQPCQVLCDVKTVRRSGTQRVRDDFSLFFLVDAVRPGRRTSRRITSDVTQFRRIIEQRLETLAHERPPAHVTRLFLRPNKLLRTRVLREQLLHSTQRKRIKLFEPHNRHAQITTLLPSLDQIVVNLATTHHDLAHRRRIRDLRIINHRSKTTAREILNVRSSRRQTQQTLRRHHDQWSLHSWPHLSSQQMKVLRGRRRITDLQIVLGAQLKIAFESSARMFRSLSFITVR